ncbi:hypothetical protein N0V84_003585 [Fusarium piperis]|uniref:Uncharacterized protein n=1 Tax=Fusarium piperis TaxID=1435070 RepID=A0A9W8WH42_9HYPO|nr:hypothetical protein N0V84_003585 [Fusarium piperis]
MTLKETRVRILEKEKCHLGLRDPGPRNALLWNPDRFKDRCFKMLATISHIKQHLKTEHYQRYCPQCYTTLSKDQADHRHPPGYENAQGAPPGSFVTYDAREKIEQIIKKRSKSATEKWQCIYRVLFPKELRCPNPFLDRHAWEKIDLLDQHIRSDRPKIILAKKAKVWRSQGFTDDQTIWRVLDSAFARLAEIINLDDQAYSSDGVPEDEADDDNDSTEPTYSSQALHLDGSSVLPDIDSHGAQPFHDQTVATLMPPGLGLDEHFGTMPGGDFEWETRSTATNGDLETFGQGVDTSETHVDFSNPPVDPDFSTNSESLTPFYEEEERLYRLGQQLDL